MMTHVPTRSLRCAVACLVALGALLGRPAPACADPGMGATLEMDDTLPVVVSLGDSYSSGEGCPDFYGSSDASIDSSEYRDWVAHRSVNAWPGQLVLDAGDKCIKLKDCKDTNWLFVAASGAESEHIYGHEQKKESLLLQDSGSYMGVDLGGVPALQPPVVSKLPKQDYIFDLIRDAGRDVDYVTLTIGGNDIGFEDVVKSLAMSRFKPGCVRDSLVYAWKLYEMGDKSSKNPNRREPAKETIYQAYEDIRTQAGNQADVIVAGYPKLFDESECVLWTEDDARLINKNIILFNEKLANLTKEADDLTGPDDGRFVFVDVVGPFESHGIGSSDPFINRIMLFARSQDITVIPPSAYSVHPSFCGNPDCCKANGGTITPNCGISAYASAVQQAVSSPDAKEGAPGLQQTPAEDFIRSLNGWWAHVGGLSTSTGSGYRSVLHMSDGAFEVYDGNGNLTDSGSLGVSDVQRLEDGPGQTGIPGWYVWPPNGYFCADHDGDLLERIAIDGSDYSGTSSYARLEGEPDWHQWDLESEEPAEPAESAQYSEWEGCWKVEGGVFDGALITIAEDGTFELDASQADASVLSDDQGTWYKNDFSPNNGIVFEGADDYYNILEEDDGSFYFYMYEVGSRVEHIQ